MIKAVNSYSRSSLKTQASLKKLENQKNANEKLSQNRVSTPLFASKAYAQVNFSGSLATHKSWGALVKKTGDVGFKLFTWPDATKVFVEISDEAPKETHFTDGFIKVLKDTAGKVTDILPEGKKSRIVELSKKKGGVFTGEAPASVAKHGDNYRFLIVKSDGEISAVKDPYSKRQKNIHGWSTIYDHNKFEWSDKAWMGGKNPKKMSRVHYKKGLSNPYDMRLSEVNIATLTEKGDFESAKKEIDKIAKDGIFNAVHIMPVENTHSFNWGYDGVDKFAPQESFLGGPDKLKELIDHAHKRELNVVMDVVPNHVGPDGCALGPTGPYLDGNGPFGSYLNFEGEDNTHVREYIANSSLNWARDYHVDGIRFDMTKFMRSDNAMKEISAEMNYHHPDVVLIAEDGRENDARVTRALSKAENTFKNVAGHIAFIDRLHKNQVSLSNLGYDTEWNFPGHKQFASAAIGSWEHHNRSMGGLSWANKSSAHRLNYPMSHDEIGNMDGTRLITKVVTNDLGMFHRVKGETDAQKGQRAAQATQKMLKSLVSGEAEKMTPSEWAKFNNSINIREVVPLPQLQASLDKATSVHKLSVGQVFVSPGPKMLFQGDESGMINPFKFFREFSESSSKEKMNLYREKGYLPGEHALNDSKMTSIDYSPKMKAKLKQVKKFTQNLARLIDENPALQHEGKLKGTVVNEGSSVYGIHRKSGDNEIFAVSNYSDYGFTKNYQMQFPQGKWVEVLNSDAKEFGGSSAFMNTSEITARQDKAYAEVSLPAHSITIFKKIN